MKICFYTLLHIGDVYLSSFFINHLCNLNKDKQFYYYFICGDVFFSDTINIKRLNIEEYNKSLYNHYKFKNGEPPENYIDNKLLNFLKSNNMDKKGTNILNYNDDEILFINTWCVSDILNTDDFNIQTYNNAFSKLIKYVNDNYKLDLVYNLDNYYMLLNYNNYDNIKNDNISLDIDYDNTIFVFNFQPRSYNYNLNNLYNYCLNNILKQNKKIIFTNYTNEFYNIENVKFIDRDFNIEYDYTCVNLIKIWSIAIKCNKIIILGTGGSWTFNHLLKDIKDNQIYYFNDGYHANVGGITYTQLLNNNIYLLSNRKNLITNML